MPTSPILVIAGTNRPDSNALKVAHIVLGHYRSAGTPAELYSLTEMSPEIFNPASYASKPAWFVAVQQRVLDAMGLHVVTPEYNGSFPGVLKYFIDMLKFPESFEAKPVAFTGEAMGSWGALRSVEQLQQIFGYRNAYLFPERVFLPAVHTLLNPAGELIDPALDRRLAAQAKGFQAFASRFGKSG